MASVNIALRKTMSRDAFFGWAEARAGRYRHGRLAPRPVLVFEVVSPNSAREDRILKLAEYHSVLSIKRHVIVEQDFVGPTIHARQQHEPWDAVSLIEGDTLLLPEIGIEIPVNDLYEGITLDAAPAAG